MLPSSHQTHPMSVAPTIASSHRSETARPAVAPNHVVISLVRSRGAHTALAELLTAGHHHTVAVYRVWAVTRLVDAGLSDVGVLWHPLLDARSPLAWWDEPTLASDEARSGWVPPTLSEPGEPTPGLPG
jgi:hypothetical protein